MIFLTSAVCVCCSYFRVCYPPPRTRFTRSLSYYTDGEGQPAHPEHPQRGARRGHRRHQRGRPIDEDWGRGRVQDAPRAK